MSRTGKQISYLKQFERPALPWMVRTDLQAVDIAMGTDDGALEFIEKQCCRGDWCMDSVQGFMEFRFIDEADAVTFKLKYA